jgi:hypothetical protein
MPADVGRDGREGRGGVRRDEPIGSSSTIGIWRRCASEQIAVRRRSGIVIVIGFCKVGFR